MAPALYCMDIMLLTLGALGCALPLLLPSKCFLL